MPTRNTIARAALDFGRVPRALPPSVAVADRAPLVIYDVDVGVSVTPPVIPIAASDLTPLVTAVEAVAQRPTAQVVVPAVDLAEVESQLTRLGDLVEAVTGRVREAGPDDQGGKTGQAR